VFGVSNNGLGSGFKLYVARAVDVRREFMKREVNRVKQRQHEYDR